MPKGEFFALTGTLQPYRKIRHYRLYTLDLADGGGWLLDTGRNVDHLIGSTVHVEGERWDFAIIDVDRIWASGDPRPLFWRERLAGWWKGVRSGSD